MRIGVSGASGQLGKAVVAELKARGEGHGIVGISRTPETVQQAADGQLEGRLGDYDRPETLLKAYDGLDRLLIIPSADVRPGLRDRHFVAAIEAAISAGVGHIVLMSSTATREAPKSEMFAAYWTGERHLITRGVALDHPADELLRRILRAGRRDVAQCGILPGLGENRVAFVSRDDVAAAAAGILLGDGPAGAIYNATGPAAVTGAERAALMSEITGKPLRFMVMDEPQLRLGLSQAGLPPDYIEPLVDIEKRFVDGSFDIVTGDVERLAGRPPRPLREVLSQQFT